MVRIGKIAAAHGLHGALILAHVTGSNKWMKKGLALFLELNKGSFIPFFVSQFKSTSPEEFIVQFEDVTSVEEAKKLSGKNVYAEQAHIAAGAPDSPLAWIGFTITDTEKGKLGAIDDVFKTAQQWLARVLMKEQEVLIPLIEQTIVHVDSRNKNIEVVLPEGLLEIYLPND